MQNLARKKSKKPSATEVPNPLAKHLKKDEWPAEERPVYLSYFLYIRDYKLGVAPSQ